jgi:Tfp pilus assembly protein PilW
MNGTIQKWGSAGAILIKSEKKDIEKIETKVVKVEKVIPTKKAKTWESVYIVKLKDGTVISTYKSKTDATKKATEEVKKRGVEIVIEQQKVLKQGSAIELTLKPQIKQEKKKEKKTVNTYLMFGWAAC